MSKKSKAEDLTDFMDDEDEDEAAGAGHNSNISGKQLKSIIERIERLEEDKKGISDDIREIYAEAKGNGFDAKAIRQIIKIRKQSETERSEQEAILEVYMSALGMI